MRRKNVVCLLSGGLDSATCLYWIRSLGLEPLALTVNYGQVHARELQSAKTIAGGMNVEHHILSIELPWKGSALLDSGVPIPEGRSLETMSKEIPVTYVPARNMILLSLAASFAETRRSEEIYIGANALDYSGYPDCRPEFFSAMESVLQKGTKHGSQGGRMEIQAPLLRYKKSEIIKLAVDLKVPLELTWSCYRGGEKPCGTCDACVLREKGFQEAGFADPLLAHPSLQRS